MARAISDEELGLKKRARRRLVGAIILVTVVVVVLPMVLDSEPKSDNQDVNIRIPSTDSGPFTPKVAPTIPPAPTPAPAAEVKPPAPPPITTAKTEPAAKPEPAPKPAPEPKTAPPAKPEPQKTAKAVEKTRPAVSYVVQVVALSDAEKAKALEQKISAAGLKAYTEVIKTEKGDVTRVRVGPLASREAAESALGKLKGMSLDGKIVAVK